MAYTPETPREYLIELNPDDSLQCLTLECPFLDSAKGACILAQIAKEKREQVEQRSPNLDDEIHYRQSFYFALAELALGKYDSDKNKWEVIKQIPFHCSNGYHLVVTNTDYIRKLNI